ncbi:MAG: DUF2382 domain-containing protein [Nitrospirota bacterium]
MKTIVGLFNTSREAEDAINDLIRSGFKREDISMMASSEEEGKGGKKGGDGGGTAKGAAKGAGTGAAVGGVAGLLVGLTGLTIPGLGPIIAAGPLAATLSGIGAGAVAGGVVGGLTKMGVPKEHAEHYAEGVRRGGTLVTVHTSDDEAERAADIMNRHGAVDIDRRTEQWKAGGWARFDEKAAPFTAEERARERAVLPVVEEEVKVGKREVSKGGVRVYSRVVEAPVEEKVTLREEHATVERRPTDRPATAAEKEAFKETSFEIRETAEEPVVSKEARVKEEVVVGKEATERTETIRETARRTEVDVEEEDFQSHFRSSAAGKGESYESYRSAYRYADTLSQDPRYRGKEWSEIEGDVRRDWESRNPGTWSKYKDAIRYGWDRMHRPVGAGRR